VPLIGIDLGGTKLASAVFAADGEILRRESVQLAGRGGDEVGALIVEQVRSTQHAARSLVDSPTGDAIGVAVPGIYRASTGTVWAPNIPGWDDYPLLDELRASVGPETRVAIDSDRAAYILGETWRGGGGGGGGRGAR
jgi:glucokinase